MAGSARDFEKLNALAPVVDAAGTAAPEATPGPAQTAAERSVICREAVLDREQRVAGYEFVLRPATRDRVRGQSRRIHHVYNEVVVRNLLQFSVGRLLGHRTAFIEVLDSFIGNPVVAELPGSGVVLTVGTLGDGVAPDELGARLAELAARGFRFALDDCYEGPHFEVLVPHASFLILRTARHSPAEIRRLVEHLGKRVPRAALVARDLQSFDDFQLCRKLGFACFQGPFVTSREDWSGNQVGPQALRVIELLNQLRREAETADLAHLLKQDAALSYRLLRYINSAASGLRQPITSIEHALVIIGRQTMYRWLTLLLFGAAEGVPQAQAVFEHALVRGRFLELIAERLPQGERESLFVVGLFSLLDRVLRVPLDEALKPLHLPAPVADALLLDRGPYAPYFDLALACESFDPLRIEAASLRCGVEPALVNARHFEALGWAQSVQQ